MKFKSKFFLLIAFFCFIFLLAVNSLKSDLSFSVSFTESKETIISHHADELYICAVTFGLIEENKLTINERITLLFGFLSESIIPQSFLPENFKFPHIIGQKVRTGGGGLFLVATYLFLGGYFGLFALGALFTLFIEYALKRKNQFVILLCIILSALSPRWISYDFHLILRITVLAYLMYYFFNIKWNTKYLK